MPLPAQCLPFIGAEQRREREREKMRERGGKGGGGERRKIREPFVLGDMRMPEKEGTIVVEREYRKGGLRWAVWEKGE